MSHKLSEQIKFNEKITKEDFTKLLDTVKVLDESEYNQESNDGFLDLFNYWNGLPLRRFELKLIRNTERIAEKTK